MVIRILLAWAMLAGAALAQGDTRLMILHDHGAPVVSVSVNDGFWYASRR